jgi:hypothetical protein
MGGCIIHVVLCLTSLIIPIGSGFYLEIFIGGGGGRPKTSVKLVAVNQLLCSVLVLVQIAKSSKVLGGKAEQ